MVNVTKVVSKTYTKIQTNTQTYKHTTSAPINYNIRHLTEEKLG